jgi:hypothetical protein
MNLDRIDLFLTERRKATKTEVFKAERDLKLAKGKDSGVNLYPDFTKFLATYLNTLENKDLNQYRVMTREKAVTLVTAVASAHPNMQAILDKLSLEPKAFVSRFWNKMDMKSALQDAIKMLLKGEKNVTVKSGEVPEEKE